VTFASVLLATSPLPPPPPTSVSFSLPFLFLQIDRQQYIFHQANPSNIGPVTIEPIQKICTFHSSALSWSKESNSFKKGKRKGENCTKTNMGFVQS
jgi:hypothetical protein